MAKSTKGIGRNATTGRYVTIGRTRDGVTVLAPATKSSHFSVGKARNAITKTDRQPSKRK